MPVLQVPYAVPGVIWPGAAEPARAGTLTPPDVSFTLGVPALRWATGTPHLDWATGVPYGP